MEMIADNGMFWHRITTALFQGGALIMAQAILVRLLSFRDWYVRGVNMRLANGTAVALLATWNFVFAILAMITGMWLTWGFETVTSLSLTLNKIMFGSFALLALVLMLYLRFRYGPDLWSDPALKASYVTFGIVTAVAAIINGSLGGEASLLGTVFEPVWNALGIVVRYPMVLPTLAGIILVAVALIVIASGLVATFVLRRRGAP